VTDDHGAGTNDVFCDCPLLNSALERTTDLGTTDARNGATVMMISPGVTSRGDVWGFALLCWQCCVLTTQQ